VRDIAILETTEAVGRSFAGFFLFFRDEKEYKGPVGVALIRPFEILADLTTNHRAPGRLRTNCRSAR
jgi:hypothetical protein